MAGLRQGRTGNFDRISQECSHDLRKASLPLSISTVLQKVGHLSSKMDDNE
jgi:hypothetical protein